MLKGQIALVEVAETRGRKKAGSLKSQVNERISKYGVGTILDEEILSVLSDIPIEKIRKLIDEYSEVGEICKNIDILNVTETQKKKLLMVFEFSKRAKYTGKQKVILDSSARTGSYLMDLLSLKAVEEFIMVALNSQNQIIGTFTISKGTVNETAVYTREIVRKAILHNAVSVIVAHNHPANNPKPSQHDITATKALEDAFRPLGIKLLDHIIVCDSEYLSFAEKGLLQS